MKLNIAYATTDTEREAIYRLRYDVYFREMHMFGEVADHAGSRLADDHDRTGRLVSAEVDGEIAGTVRMHWGGDAPLSEEYRRTYGLEPFLEVVEPARILVVTRLIIRSAYRRSEVILALLRTCAEFGRAHQTTLAFCDCQPHLISLYQSLGFRPYTVAYNDAQFGIMIPLVLLSPDVKYLEHLRSPLADVVRGWPDETSNFDRLKYLVPETPPVRTIVPSQDTITSEFQALLAPKDSGRVGFFDELDEDQFRRLLKRGHLIECARGDFVIRRGQILRTLFVVLKGELEARSNGVIINVVPAGECFGEIAFLHGIPRTVDVVAKSPRVVVLALNESVVRTLIRDDAAIAAKLLLNLARGLALRLARREAVDSVP